MKHKYKYTINRQNKLSTLTKACQDHLGANVTFAHTTSPLASSPRQLVIHMIYVTFFQ